MKCPVILIFTGLDEGPLAATTLRISRIYSYPKYAQCWELEPISRLKSAKFPIHLTWWTWPFLASKKAPILKIVHIKDWKSEIWNVVAARGPTCSPSNINMKGHFIFTKS